MSGILNNTGRPVSVDDISSRVSADDFHYPNITIRFIKDNYSLFELKRKIEEHKTIVLDPDFQRAVVWNDRQNSELLESILMGIPIPILYFFEDENGVKQVVDGRQRLSCIIDFFNDKFRLKNLNLLPEFNNMSFHDLPLKYQAKIEDYQITVYTIQYPTPDVVKFDIFDRVNRGGTKLNNQEMRNALYGGKSTILLGDLAHSEEFVLVTGGAVSSKRMRDKYMIIRSLGFYLLRTNQLVDVEYKSDMDEFLAKVMKHINNMPDKDIANLKSIFLSSMGKCAQVLGEDGLRFEKYSSGSNSQRRPINMALFEILTYLFCFDVLAKNNPNKLRDLVEELKDEIDKSGTLKFIDSNVAIKYRFEEIESLRDSLL